MAARYVDKVAPFYLSPEALDWYLARGWYRMGGHIFTTHFLCFDQQIYSAIWIRLDLRGFEFSKSQRKLLRRNSKRFEHRVGPIQITGEKEMLYLNYAHAFNGRLTPSLRDNLGDYEDYPSIYNTYEIGIRDRESNQLIAASYFDLGKKSAASILGIYEPNYDRYSLGYYTMLLEIQYLQQKGYRYYYPGYVVPGYDRFEYKKRIGPTQYLDLNRGWLPTLSLDEEHIPSKEQVHRLHEMQSRLKADYPCSTLFVHPLFEAKLYHPWPAEYLEYPYVLGLEPIDDSVSNGKLIVWDPTDKQYIMYFCQYQRGLQHFFADAFLKAFDKDNYLLALIEPLFEIYRSDSAAAMADAARKIIKEEE